jgi:hypothetical protein
VAGFRTAGTAAKDRAVTLRNALAGAGISASLEPGDVEPPGAWVRVQSMTMVTLADVWSVRFQVYLVAPDVGALEAWDVLSGLLDRALTVIEPDEPVNTATSVVLPHTPNQPLPAFLLVVDELVET